MEEKRDEINLDKWFESCVDSFYEKRLQQLHSIDLSDMMAKNQRLIAGLYGRLASSQIISILLENTLTKSDKDIFIKTISNNIFHHWLNRESAIKNLNNQLTKDLIDNSIDLTFSEFETTMGSIINDRAVRKIRLEALKLYRCYHPQYDNRNGRLFVNPSFFGVLNKRVSNFWQQETGVNDFAQQLWQSLSEYDESYYIRYIAEYGMTFNRLERELLVKYSNDYGIINWTTLMAHVTTRTHHGLRKIS